MPRTATIKSLPRAFRMMKAMRAQGIEWGEDYRQAARAALKDVLEGQMAAGIDRHLDEMAGRGGATHSKLSGLSSRPAVGAGADWVSGASPVPPPHPVTHTTRIQTVCLA